MTARSEPRISWAAYITNIGSKSALREAYFVSAEDTRRFWSDWKKSLLVVAPETVVRWHRAGFRLYWSMISKIRKRIGRRRISREVRDLIFRMAAENPTWGAPRIHGELLMLGFDVSERSVSRWMKRAPRDPELARRWLAFLRNHREAITVPWISSRSQRSLSSCCTASLLLGIEAL